MKVRSGVRLENANRTGNRVDSIRAASGEVFEADHFVLAAGGWSGQLARKFGSRTPITGGKGYAITVHNPDISVKQTPFFAKYESVAIPYDGTLRFTGFLELSGVNMKLPPRRIKALRRVAERYLQKFPRGNTEEHWTGMRACTPDGVPAIGRLPGLNNGGWAAVTGITAWRSSPRQV